jgi:hypothetical protein
MALDLVSFGSFSLLAFWIVFLDGAERLEGWGAFFVFNWFAASRHRRSCVSTSPSPGSPRSACFCSRDWAGPDASGAGRRAGSVSCPGKPAARQRRPERDHVFEVIDHEFSVIDDVAEVSCSRFFGHR